MDIKRMIDLTKRLDDNKARKELTWRVDNLVDKFDRDVAQGEPAEESKANVDELVKYLYLNAVTTKLRGNDFEGAVFLYGLVAYCGKKIDDFDRSAAALGGIADCYRELGRNEEALDKCREALTLEIIHGGIVAELHYDVGVILIEMERYEEARDQLKVVLENGREIPKIREKLEYAVNMCEGEGCE